MQAAKIVAMSVLLIVGVAFIWTTSATAAAKRTVQKGESCQQTCPKSSCSKTCSGDRECVSYCSPNDYAICSCVKPDKKRPR